MQTTKEYPAFFKVVNVEFDILPDDFKWISVYNWNIEDDLVLLQLEIVAELFHVLLVLVEARVEPEQLVVFLVVFLDEESVHYQNP